ncbi:hypothetical protein SAMN05421759_10994 [Roseivivax lentus]|uniref:Uncharacterized protein n=1 Tax=Roseivivax lentus TaxID=633194 RepID=A0A1N7NPM7_9RHOB|nr:hypothetical protein [Roseivivax lentus]SIT00267.1 hypothetical protein SAMN05421759_10994 [Roseivivax lentus]
MLDTFYDDDFEDDFGFEDDDFEDGDDLFDPEDIEAMEALADDFAEGFEDDDLDEDAFLGALAGLAARALPMVKRAAPMLLKAGRSILGRLSRSTTVRNAARAVPTILRKTAADQARRVASGQRLTRQSVLKSAARHTAQALDPRRRRRIIRKHRQIVRRRPVRPPTRSGAARYRRVCRCRMVRY